MAEEPNLGSEAGPRALPPPVPERDASAADRVRDVEFPVVMRGYDREAVDAFAAETGDLVEALESRQSRESVVQRALEEVGEQTSAILKQAHESGDDITARSRSQAEDRVQRAREEAEAIIRAAEGRAAKLEQETLALREERAGLLEDLRRLAAETLAVAREAEEGLGAPPMADLLEEAPAPPYDGGDEAEPFDDWQGEDTEQHETAELRAPSADGPPDEPPRALG